MASTCNIKYNISAWKCAGEPTVLDAHDTVPIWLMTTKSAKDPKLTFEYQHKKISADLKFYYS